MKKLLLSIAGFAALGLGGIGIFLPVLPTTPFVLCAAGCFSAANPALYRKLANSRYFGEYIRNYREKTGVSHTAKLRALIFLWLTLSVSAAVFRRPLVWAILALVGAAVSAHIALLRKKKEAERTISCRRLFPKRRQY
jgi:uncharacterized membrane protein YbaN (DUF454 family)